MTTDIPVFDRRDTMPAILEDDTDWRPQRSPHLPGIRISLPSDGPDLEWRHAAQAARVTSNRYSGQHDNDNDDWPLKKLLVTDGNTHCLTLARQYRALEELATRPIELVGKEADNLYIVTNEDAAGKPKESKLVRGRKANVETEPVKKTVASDTTRKLSASVPKKWTGDRLLLAAIDARRELAYLRGKLGFVPKILEAFEWAVVDNLTLAEIGARLGAGSKGAKGEARARIFDGFGIVDRYWRHRNRSPRANRATYASSWWRPGMDVPAGYYRSVLDPDRIFPKCQAA